MTDCCLLDKDAILEKKDIDWYIAWGWWGQVIRRPLLGILSRNPVVQSSLSISFNSLKPRRNRCHFADDIFKWVLLKISLKFVPKVRINNIPALVQFMAWRWPGDKPLSEPMMVRLPTHICVTRPQWVKDWPPGNVDEIYRWLTFEWVVVTWHKDGHQNNSLTNGH